VELPSVLTIVCENGRVTVIDFGTRFGTRRKFRTSNPERNRLTVLLFASRQSNNVNLIPREIEFPWTDFHYFGMQRGGLTMTIPTEIGRLTNLEFWIST
jgi:hypothetical protein